jgi:uncharacterized DUF497 family protein
MDIAFDPETDLRNIEKHGVSLADATLFEWDGAINWPDLRHDYGEDRMIAIGYIGNRLFTLIYVDRVPMRRVISLRKSNKREERTYAET